MSNPTFDDLAAYLEKKWGKPFDVVTVAQVVAALRDQGLVVVRRDDVSMMEHDILENAGAEWETTYREVVPDLYAAVARVGSALAAPGNGEEA